MMKKNVLLGNNIARYERVRVFAEHEINGDEHARAHEILTQQKVALFIVAYNAEKHIKSVISRIGKEYLPLFAEIIIIDDSSNDSTFAVASEIKREIPNVNLNVYRTPYNRGYGGNQKIGYLYAIKRKYDIVILLHGDGQYAPEFLPRVIAAFQKNTHAVLASRMIHKKMALEGGMPFYKWVGNQILTGMENVLLGTHFSEFHTGFRAFRCEALERVPFIFNSDGFHFDTEILIQAVASHWNIEEVSIPTLYGEEVSNVNGIQYAYNCVKSIIKYHFTNIGLFYERNFDFSLFDTDNYQFKRSKNSLHQYVLRALNVNSNSISIDLGANRGILSKHISEKVQNHTAVDITMPDLAGKSKTLAMDLDTRFSSVLGNKKYDCCITLDVVEHMKHPEIFLEEVFAIMKTNAQLYISTANIGYIFMRLSLLLGQFNYGKRGILDKTHTRLFTVRTMKKLLHQYGFSINDVVGFAPPLTDLISNNILMRILENILTFLARMLPNLFSYNFLVIATRRDDIEDIFMQTVHSNK